MLQAIAFDFDGVLVDSEPLHFRALAQVGKTIGFSLDWERYCRDIIGYDDRDAFRAMMRERNLPEDEQQLADLCDRKQEAIDQLIAAGVPMIPGARALLDEIDKAGQPRIAIASGATARDIEQMLAGLKLRDRFRVVISADDVMHSKPHPRTYALAAECLGVAPQHCLAIEDTPAGLQSARDAGLMTLGLATSGPAALLHRAQRVVPDLTHVTLADLQAWYG